MFFTQRRTFDYEAEKPDNQSNFGMWQARTGKREEALTCAAGYRPHHQSSSGGHHDTQNSIQWVSSRSSP